jgi:hypothetical protein
MTEGRGYANGRAHFITHHLSVFAPVHEASASTGSGGGGCSAGAGLIALAALGLAFTLKHREKP